MCRYIRYVLIVCLCMCVYVYMLACVAEYKVLIDIYNVIYIYQPLDVIVVLNRVVKYNNTRPAVNRPNLHNVDLCSVM